MPPANSSTTLTPTIAFENLQAHQRTFALKAAIELDIFRAVGQGPGDVASIARHAKASERGTRILCDFLVIDGLLQKKDGRYRHTLSSAAFLDPSSPSCVASVVGFLSLPSKREPFEHRADSCAPDALSCRATAPWKLRTPCGWISPRVWHR
jgi:hypothetical protein